MLNVLSASFNSLKSHTSALIPLTDLGVVKVSGQEAGNFLQGQLTCDISKIADQAQLGALCNHQGRVLAIFYLIKESADYFCFLPREIIAFFVSHLMKFAVFSRVLVEDVSENYFVHGAFDEQDMVTPAHAQIHLLPGAEKRFLVWGPTTVQLAVTSASAPAWKLANMLSGLSQIYLQTIGLVTPHMLNLHLLDAISFTKGCYVGQEIIARTHYLGKSKRSLYMATTSVATQILPGDVVYANGQECGWVIDILEMDEHQILQVVIQDANVDQQLSVNTTILTNITKAV